MVRALDFGASGPSSRPGRGYCVVFLGKLRHLRWLTTVLIDYNSSTSNSFEKCDSPLKINCENFIMGCTVGFRAILDESPAFTSLNKN